MTTLIIGGSGFLGAELIRQATEAGHTTAATYATGPGPGDPAQEAAWYPLDLRKTGQLDTVMAEAGPRLDINAPSGRADRAITAEDAVRPPHTAVRPAERSESRAPGRLWPSSPPSTPCGVRPRPSLRGAARRVGVRWGPAE